MDEQSLTLKPCENVEHCGSRVAPGFEAEKHQVFGRVGRCTQVTGYITVTFPTKTCASGTCFFFSENTTTYPGVAESHVFFSEKKHLLALLCVIQGMNVSHHSDPVRGADGAVSWVHGFHRSGCVVPSWQSPRFFSKAFLMLRDPLKQSLGDVDLSIANGDKQCPSNSGILHHDVT